MLWKLEQCVTSVLFFLDPDVTDRSLNQNTQPKIKGKHIVFNTQIKQHRIPSIPLHKTGLLLTFLERQLECYIYTGLNPSHIHVGWSIVTTNFDQRFNPPTKTEGLRNSKKVFYTCQFYTSGIIHFSCVESNACIVENYMSSAMFFELR